MPDHRTKLASSAQLCAARGWHVFPLLPGSKNPLIRDWENHASTDPELIRHAWSFRPWNIALATGPSGLVVVDLDTTKPGETVPEPWASRGIGDGAGVLTALLADGGHPPLPDTFTVATPNGGRHLYFAAPSGVDLRCTNGDQGHGLGWHIDTRHGGGYVVAAGSTTTAGTYRIVDGRTPAPLPDWIADALAPRPLPPQSRTIVRTTTSRHSSYVQAALNGEAHRVCSAADGNRNYALYLAACALGQLVAGAELTADDVTQHLLHAAENHVADRAFTWNQARRTIASGLKTGHNRPRSVAA